MSLMDCLFPQTPPKAVGARLVCPLGLPQDDVEREARKIERKAYQRDHWHSKGKFRRKR